MKGILGTGGDGRLPATLREIGSTLPSPWRFTAHDATLNFVGHISEGNSHRGGRHVHAWQHDTPGIYATLSGHSSVIKDVIGGALAILVMILNERWQVVCKKNARLCWGAPRWSKIHWGGGG